MKFLKLTSSTAGDSPVWINVNAIRTMRAYTDHRGVHDYTEINFNGNEDWEQVRETPEQIIKAINS